MNAQVRLTALEIAQVRKNVFNDNRADFDFVHEAMGEYRNWHKALLSGDSVELSRLIDQAVFEYCERCGYFAEAERELLASIERSGGRRWFYAD